MVDSLSQLEAEADAAARAGRMTEARRLLERAVEQTPARQQTWVKLASARRALGDLKGALAATLRALALDPLDFSALLAKAALLEKLGRTAAAGEAYGHALAQRPPEGQEPAMLRPILAHAQTCYSAYQQATLTRIESSLDGQTGLSDEEQGKLRRFCSNIARITTAYPQQPTHFHYPGMPAFEFHHRSRLPWLARLEAATPVIRAEFDALLASEAAFLEPYVQYPEDVPLRQWEQLNHSREWTAVHLLLGGQRVEQNARHCPQTLALLETLPQPTLPGRSPNAMFSLLAPRTRIPAHHGVSNTRLVCHLPLIVPPSCGFRVGAETRQWEVGKAFVFDDTIEHEAWNDSDELRVVLIFDVWAWALSEEERKGVAAVMAASDADAMAGL